MQEDSVTPAREQQAEHGPAQRKQDRLDDQLPHQSQSRCPERLAHGHFFSASGGAGHQKAGDIGAGDQQYQSDDSHEDVKGLLVIFSQVGQSGGGWCGSQDALAELVLRRGVPILRHDCPVD